MAIIADFCFACSVRLGAIIVSILTLVQATALLVVTVDYMDSLTVVKDTLNKWLDYLKIDDHSLFRAVANHPNGLITTSTIYFSLLITCCILCLYGAAYCKSSYIYPLVIFYSIYIAILGIVFIFLMLFVKNEGSGLGDLILYSSLGGFVLLFYLYTWTCIVSLIQIIDELKLRLKRKLKAAERLNFVQLVKNNSKLNSNNNKNTKGHHNNYNNFIK